MNRGKFIALIVSMVVTLGAGAALGESRSENNGGSFANTCETGDGEYSIDYDENGDATHESCDLGDGYGVTCFFGTDNCIEWEWDPATSASPSSDPDPTPGVGTSPGIAGATYPGPGDRAVAEHTETGEPARTGPGSDLTVRGQGEQLEERTVSSDQEAAASGEATEGDAENEANEDEELREDSDETSGSRYSTQPFTRSADQQAK